MVNLMLLLFVSLTILVVSDTLSKLMEYGEEDDDPDEAGEESCKNNCSVGVAPKPFWAV